MGIPISERRSISERSNLNSSLPAVLSIDKAVDIVEFCSRKKVGNPPNVDTFGRNCWGSPIDRKSVV